MNIGELIELKMKFSGNVELENFRNYLKRHLEPSCHGLMEVGDLIQKAGSSWVFEAKGLDDEDLAVKFFFNVPTRVYSGKNGGVVSDDVLRNSSACGDEIVIGDCEREARINEAIVERNIGCVVEYVDWNFVEDVPFMIFKKVGEGDTLIDLMELDLNEEFGIKEKLGTIWNIVYPLSELHSLGIAHLDVKPGNYMFNSRDGLFYLGDFGIAKHVGDSGIYMGEIVHFTPEYFTPEHVSERRVLSKKTDIYAAGLIAYEILFGTRARGEYDGGKESFVDYAKREGFKELRPNIDWCRSWHDLHYTTLGYDIIREMLKVSPEERSESVEVLENLEELLNLI